MSMVEREGHNTTFLARVVSREQSREGGGTRSAIKLVTVWA